jgi:hemerythrin-like domain-containing protein
VEKEERVFSCIRQRVPPGTLEDLVSGHRLVKESLRTLLGIVEEDLESMDGEHVRSVIGDILGYVRLRRAHISREESRLNLAASILNEDDDRRFLEEFKEVEATTLKPGGREGLLKLLEEAELLLRIRS